MMRRRSARSAVWTLAGCAALALGLAALPTSDVRADEIGGSGFTVPEPAPPPPVAAPPPPWVEMESRSVAAGVGFQWGGGLLSFDGRQHAFDVKGVSLGDVGVARLVHEGAVENLERLEDFEGTYVAVSAGAAAGKGASVLSVRNEHGVTITLRGDVSGLALKLGAEGFRIALR